jgi:hypothetical protein
MINARMHNYEYFTLEEPDEYGQQNISANAKGTIKISISNISTTTSESIKYKEADYIGLTLAPIDDSYIIAYNGIKLKVRYVISDSRYKQVFMSEI